MVAGCDMTPSFEQWVDYCFAQGPADSKVKHKDLGYEAAQRRLDLYAAIPAELLVGHFKRLFETPELLANHYSDDQIAAGLWFALGVSGQFVDQIIDDADVDELDVAAALRAVPTFYVELLDRLCCRHGTDPDGEYINDGPEIDGATYILWDLTSIGWIVKRRKRSMAIADAAFDALTTILRRCRTSSCQISAFHALGHMYEFAPQRVQETVDRRLKAGRLAKWVRDYAGAARVGYVQ